MSAAPTILVAGIFHESHATTPLRTRAENFMITRGAALIEKARGSDAALGGAVRYLLGEAVTLLPTLTAVSPPGGLLERGLCASFINEILEIAKGAPPDGVFLDLHGAIAGEDMPAFEAELCAALRGLLGPAVPIAVALDMHGIVSPALNEACDHLVSCKNNPHDDYKDAGERAARFLIEGLRGGLKLHRHAEWIPLRIPYPLETASHPLDKIHAARRALERGDVLDLSILNSYPFGTRAPGGQCILVTSRNSPAHAQAIAQEMRAVFERYLPEFVTDLPKPAEALAELKGLSQPLILGDFGDRVLAGSPGDGTGLAQALLALEPDLRLLAPITDPSAVAQAKALGAGAVAHFAVGGHFATEAPPLTRDWEVVSLSEGLYRLDGPFMRGELTSCGDCAVLRSGNLWVLATSMPALTQDRAAYRAAGLRIADFQIVIVKSGSHYKLSLAEEGYCLNVSTPGFTSVD